MRKTRVKRVVKEVDPESLLPRLSELEIMKIARFDAELRRISAESKATSLEIYRLDREHDDSRKVLLAKKNELVVEVGRIQPQYQELIKGVSENFGIPEEFLVIDFESGVVRDQREM